MAGVAQIFPDCVWWLPMINDLLFRLRALFRRDELDSDLADELSFHIEREAQKYVQSGLPPNEALRRARQRFGGLDQVKEGCQDARGVRLAETMAQDVRYGVRILSKSPGFTAIAVLTLALGLGASTAVFSLVNAILLKPLPYPNPERIVMPWRLAPPGLNLGFAEYPWGRVDFLHIAEQVQTFESIGAFKSDSFNLTGSGEPALLKGLRASAGFFPSLGVKPILGRTFRSDEDTPGHEHEAILSYKLWATRFSADPGVLDRAIDLNGAPYKVVGVMPAGFSFPRAEEMPGGFLFPREAELWVPLALDTGALIPNEPSELAVISRLKPGGTIQQAQIEMDLFRSWQENQNPRAKGWYSSHVTPLAGQIAGGTQRPLLLIFAAVAVVLLIACSNVASLLLTRSIGRKREFTIRAALGAGRARLARQLLTESLILAAAGGLGGMLFAQAGVSFVKAFGPSNIPRLSEVSIDPLVLGFGLAITLITGVLFGLAPAIGAARHDVVESLKEGAQRAGGSPRTQRLRKGLLVSQVSLAMVLVVAAGLLARTFSRLLEVNAGFNASNVLTFELSLPSSKYSDTARIVSLYNNALHSLQTLPGVESAGIVETIPMDGAADSTGIRIPGHLAADDKEIPYANYTIASPGYLEAVGTPILRGREFLETDTADSPPVTVINNAMAKKYWPGEDAIGKQVGPGSLKYPLMTIVGIAADVKHLTLREEPGPEMYVLYTQKPWPSMQTMQVALRARGNPDSMMSSVRQAIGSLDPDLPLAKVSTLRAIVDNSMASQRFAMLLLASFGAIALLLASIGMYGVISYSVAQRVQEIGVRVALGADRQDILGMVLGQGARLAGLGIAIGLVAAFAATRLMTSFLYGVRPTDPLTFVGVSLLLIGVALLGCYLPARRALRVDPMTALRSE
jgi:predicted permease